MMTYIGYFIVFYFLQVIVITPVFFWVGVVSIYFSDNVINGGDGFWFSKKYKTIGDFVKDVEENVFYEAYMSFRYISLMGVLVSFAILLIGVICLISAFIFVYVFLLLFVPVVIKLYNVVKFVTSWVKVNVFSKLSFLHLTEMKQYFLNIRIN